MNLRTRVWAKFAVLAALCSILIPSMALAQDDRSSAAVFAALGVFLLFIFAFCLAMYIYHALALSTIAKKTNTENPWLAWIPIANIYLWTLIAKKEWWWTLLCFVPLVNIVIIVILWMAIAEARNKPNWWGILVIIPPISLIVPGYLAWSD